ncbi:hypothetical protein ABI59_03375 [Acidobacteria bacterium Mor1]|nr:hypothetical protein ABI59_03375 [Acidobacteria bacterium Mor1]
MPKTILLADDSVTIRKVIELTFSTTDMRVEAVADGDTAMARIQELRPDLVIADVVMPGADGYEICRVVKRDHPGVGVLLLAGSFEPFDAERARECGADGHLTKPFDSQELVDRARALLEAPAAAPEPQAVVEAPQEPRIVAEERPLLTPVPDPEPAAAEPSPHGHHGEQPPDDDEPVGFELTEVTEVTGSQLGIAPLPRVPAHLAESDSGDADELEEVMDDLAASEDEPASQPGFATPIDVKAATSTYVVEAPLEESDSAEPLEEPRPESAAARPAGAADGPILSDADIEAIAVAVVERISDQVCREIAWEVVPDLAEAIIRERLRELESESES